MNIILSVTLICPLAFAAQLISTVPEAQIRLSPFYLSSQQQDGKFKLASPGAMAVARSGNIYIYDDGNRRIVKLDPRGKFIAEFGQGGSGLATVDQAGLNDSIAVDEDENVYVGDTSKVMIFSSEGKFQRTFRVPFAFTSIAVNRKHEVFLTSDTTRSTELIYVFSDTGKFLRRFGDRLIKSPGSLARNMNIAVATCDANDNLFVAFRSWPVIRKYSAEGQLISETQFTIPAELIREPQRKYYSLDFFAQHPDSAFVPPMITHSISISGRGRGYLLLNAHSIVVFASSGTVTKQFRFRAPRDRENVFIRLAANPKTKAATYLLDTRSGEIYEASTL
ncbi:MAG TPA: NHL repeat-containing protein [Pyrinomonadaceae bacterium]|nr:NHL repeat-containing protein [Pyrinomonadaceae bacterium]